MKPARIDPRILRTRAALREALVGLLRDHRFEDLTLNEIAAASGLNRATIYKHHADKFALLDAVIADELQHRLLAATGDAAPSGGSKLAAVVAAACLALQWVASLGRSDDRLLRPIAEARIRSLLRHVVEYGLAEKLVTTTLRPELAAAMASAAIYGAADAWTRGAATSQRALDAYVAKVLAALDGVIAPSTQPFVRPQRPLTFDA